MRSKEFLKKKNQFGPDLADLADACAHDLADYIADMPRKLTRAAARAKGLPRYFTGEPCGHGHVAERYTASRACVVCSLANVKRHSATRKGERTRKRWRQSEAGRRANNNPAARARRARYARTAKGRAAVRRYVHSAKGKATAKRAMERYAPSPLGRERNWQFNNSPKGRERTHRYHVSPKGREAAWQRKHPLT